jgi:hypothetical protein
MDGTHQRIIHRIRDEDFLRTGTGDEFQDVISTYEKQFTLFEMAGTFNSDYANQGRYNLADRQLKTLSLEYVKSLESKEHFHIVDIDTYVSTSFIIHMCRCPVVRAMNPLMVWGIVKLCSFSGASSNEDAFRNWITNEDVIRRMRSHTQELNVLFSVINPGELFQRGLSIIRATFAMRNVDGVGNINEYEGLHSFFDMEFVPWYEGLRSMAINQGRIGYEKVDLQSLVFAIPDPVVSWVKGYTTRVVSNAPGSIGMSDAKTSAQQLDLYYAKLVHGSCVKVPMSEIWCPNNEMEHTERDTDAFFKIMWGSLKDVLEQVVMEGSGSSSAAAQGRMGVSVAGAAGAARNGGADIYDNLIRSIRGVKASKQVMKEIWEASKDYRISDRIHMTEVQVLQRLKVDGVFPWIDRAPAPHAAASGSGGREGARDEMQNSHVCFYMRR